MRAAHFISIAVVAAACAEPSEAWPLGRAATLVGDVAVPDGVTGDAWVLLYRAGEGPPGAPAEPLAATAVPAMRLSEGDRRYTIASVAPNPLRLWTFLDVNSNFDPEVDVLAQPGAGDRVGDGLDINVQPGRTQRFDVSALKPVDDEPPAFSVEGAPATVLLDDSVQGLTTITLVSDGVGRLDSRRLGFVVRLVDVDGDGRPDDADGDGVPDLSFQAFLRWLPRPGQGTAGSTVIAPVVFNPAAFLSTLNGSLSARVTTTRLQGVLVPVAQELFVDERGKPTVRPFGAMPRGDYELVVLVTGGQFWRVPNQLATQLPSQATRFHFDRVSR